MARDSQRVERIQHALREAALDALVCALPKHVLMISGYWPVIGVSVALVTREGQVAVLAPEDEQQLAQQGWADNLRTFSPGSLTELRPTAEIVGEALTKTIATLGLRRSSAIGYENDAASVPAPYAALHLFGAAIGQLIQSAIPEATLCPAGKILARLESVLTDQELDHVRTACQLGGTAFERGARAARAGLRESEIAAAFQAALLEQGQGVKAVERAGGWAWCMSGPNSAEASGAYARTRHRQVEHGDLVLLHSNSYADGFWTDITRTFCIGPPDERKRAMYEAVFEAFKAAFATITPGVTGAAVDHAARQVLAAHGFGQAFKHGTGHGVGFGAISHWARPRLHPLSPDVLETGMVFNVEPAIYVERYGGLRHCSMVAVTGNGAELLTPFQSDLAALMK